MTDWLAICRRAVDDVEAVLRELPPGEDRERVLRRGEGGDDTTAVDAESERVVVARLDAEGGDFTLVSEELGIRSAREGSRTYVVVDPIDGSINAKRGIPFFSLSIAVADGPAMGDVHFGYVYDFGSGEEWTARRSDGATLNDEPLAPVVERGRIELLSLEATRTDLVAQHAVALVPVAHRVRVMGSLALSLCHLAAGRVDAVCSLKPARSVDIAAAQLLVSELGLVQGLVDRGSLAEHPLDLEGRSRIAAAVTREHYEQLAAALTAGA
ncbi:MAG TPA: inositol monophosphatase family protein [Gaiellaceae bacterium]|nr:inositol monophosphatase family protein [Gaiellaceae bacterium]